jgi:hypothetical protein
MNSCRATAVSGGLAGLLIGVWEQGVLVAAERENHAEHESRDA